MSYERNGSQSFKDFERIHYGNVELFASALLRAQDGTSPTALYLDYERRTFTVKNGNDTAGAFYVMHPCVFPGLTRTLIVSDLSRVCSAAPMYRDGHAESFYQSEAR